jgi:exoribonuclease R
MVCHYQLKALIQNKPAPFSRTGLADFIARIENVNAEIRKLERASERHWLLKYLNDALVNGQSEWSAVVSRCNLAPSFLLGVRGSEAFHVTVTIKDTGFTERLLTTKKFEMGEGVVVKVEAVDLHGGAIAMRIM